MLVQTHVHAQVLLELAHLLQREVAEDEVGLVEQTQVGEQGGCAARFHTCCHAAARILGLVVRLGQQSLHVEAAALLLAVATTGRDQLQALVEHVDGSRAALGDADLGATPRLSQVELDLLVAPAGVLFGVRLSLRGGALLLPLRPLPLPLSTALLHALDLLQSLPDALLFRLARCSGLGAFLLLALGCAPPRPLPAGIRAARLAFVLLLELPHELTAHQCRLLLGLGVFPSRTATTALLECRGAVLLQLLGEPTVSLLLWSFMQLAQRLLLLFAQLALSSLRRALYRTGRLGAMQ
mmetsp:Transcript_37083/g.93043  ORF Transcript_37083/g.93043 Transcript_37083/m.93043 type:complete len:296 (-) Transcript_37083:459-1346(-)